MADPVEDYQNRQLSTLNSDIATEGHNADWSSWFSSVPAADALRQQRNVTQLIADAVNRKQAILAETNEQAQRIYFDNQKFGEWQRQQPMREQLLQTQIDHESALTDAERAHQQYEMGKDIKSAQQFVPFTAALSSLPPGVTRGSKEHHDYIYNVASQYPDAAMSTAGREILNREASAFDREREFNQRQQHIENQQSQFNISQAQRKELALARFGQQDRQTAGREWDEQNRAVTNFAMQYGVDPQFDPVTHQPSIELTRAYAEDQNLPRYGKGGAAGRSGGLDAEGLFDSPDAIRALYPNAVIGQSQAHKGKFYIQKIPAPKQDSLTAIDKDLARQGLVIDVFANPQHYKVNENFSNDVVSIGEGDKARYIPKTVWNGWKERIASFTGGTTPKPASSPSASPRPSAAPSATPDVTQQDYERLPSGGTYYWQGKKYTKK